ncbi:MAG: hydroxymethylbilane synthase, partial [Thermoguttaceae bacterium]|nr:hydroxymethylbilane synthase [Thermoguttaceae bacterium]
KTAGDRNRTDSILNLGAQGVFAKEIQLALLENRIDLAVHSLKDLPVEPVPGLVFAATLDREEVSDVFVSVKYKTPDELPDGARVGTGSLRRRCQLAHRLRGKDVRIDDLRGNVETRLKKLDAGEYDAVILAAAGLKRLGFGGRIDDPRRLAPPEFLPAPGQGALGLECRADDAGTLAVLDKINRREVYAAVTAERAFLAALRGGCIAPIGAYARFEEGRLVLDGRILSLDGAGQYDVNASGGSDADAARRLGEAAAEKLTTPEVRSILDEVNRIRERNGK